MYVYNYTYINFVVFVSCNIVAPHTHIHTLLHTGHTGLTFI